MISIRSLVASVALLVLVNQPVHARVGAPAHETVTYSITPTERNLDGTQVIRAAYKNNGSYTVNKTKWSVYGYNSDHDDKTKIWSNTYNHDIKSTGEREFDDKFVYYYGFQKSFPEYAYYSLKLEIWISGGSSDKKQETGDNKDVDTFKGEGGICWHSHGQVDTNNDPQRYHGTSEEEVHCLDQSDCNTFNIKCTG